MIITLVQFDLPEPVSVEQATALFEGSAHHYRDMPGLIRKHYVLSEDGSAAGGIYLWDSREAAERVYDGAWRKMVIARYGSEPRVTWFESPVSVDNVAGKVLDRAG